MKEKIVIIVSGGVVQSVFSSNKEIDIDLLDFDNEKFQNDNLADEEFIKRTIELAQVL